MLSSGLHIEKVSTHRIFSADLGEAEIIVTYALFIESLKWTKLI